MSAIAHSRTLWRVLFALFALSSLIIFILFHRDRNSGQQFEFDSWLGQLEQSQFKGETLNTPVTLSLHLGSSAESSDMQLESGNNTKNLQIVRILQLAREAKIFDDSGTSAAKDASQVEFQVRSGDKVFRSALQEEKIQANAQARNLLKLFEIYSASQG